MGEGRALTLAKAGRPQAVAPAPARVGEGST